MVQHNLDALGIQFRCSECGKMPHEVQGAKNIMVVRHGVWTCKACLDKEEREREEMEMAEVKARIETAKPVVAKKKRKKRKVAKARVKK